MKGEGDGSVVRKNEEKMVKMGWKSQIREKRGIHVGGGLCNLVDCVWLGERVR